jgi:hypothetical protein
MWSTWAGRVLVIGVLAVGVAACDDEVPSTPTGPSNPVTENFSGSVNQNGAQTHTFTTAASGEVRATLKELTPDSSLVIGFSLGNWNPTTSICQIVLANDAATGGSLLSGSMSGSGNLCVRVYDVGNIAATPAAYTVEVVHP